MNVFIKNFKDGKDLKVNLTLYNVPKDSMVIAIPKHFITIKK